MAGELRIFLAGDVMTGRGVDQVLACPGDPELREAAIRDARDYVRLAEAVNGHIPRAADPAWPWGDALPALDAWQPHVRLINVETSATTSDDFAPGKAVHYRMHPGNVATLTAARPDACALANNHVLDFGISGLEETLDALDQAGLHHVGAGRDEEQAWRPLALPAGDHRVLVWSVGTASSGVPARWAARPDRPGVAFLGLTEADATDLGERVRRAKRPGDLAVVSVHWGSNWGYDVPRGHVRFAHRLVDCGVDVVHGHSSHHPRPVEVYRDRLVLYGCGDLVNDYEGIGSYPRFRDDLRLLYFADLRPDGRLDQLRMVPLESRQLRLHRATAPDTRWLRRALHRASRPYGSHIDLDADGSLLLRRRQADLAG